MDNKKDIKRQINYKDAGNDLSLNHNFSVHNRYYYLILKRIEKLGAASYILTDHIDDFEPIKNSIRTCALSLLKDTHSPEYHFGKKDKKDKNIGTLACIEHILSLLNIAQVTGMISSGNHSVIKNEYLLLRDAVIELSEDIENKIIFPDDLFLVAGSGNNTLRPHSPAGGGSNSPQKHKGHYKGHVPYNNVLLKNEHTSILRNDNDGLLSKREDRGRVILDLIGKNGELNIKDIHSHFTDCSEKTIQRELSKMLIRGLIFRKGDKRWSRYSLASK